MTKDTDDTVFAEAGDDELEKRTVFTGPPSTVTEEMTEAGLDTDRLLRAPPAPQNNTPEPIADRTSFAQEGMKLGVNFAYKFAKHAVGARSHLKLRLHEPGVSTAGGMNARQSIVLVAGGKDRGTTVIGWLDTSRHRAALKTWDVLAAQHEQRHKTSFDVSRDEYERLAQEIRDFLHGNDILLETHEAAADPAIAESGAAPRAGVKEWSLTYRHVLGLIAVILLAGMILGSMLAKSCGSDDRGEDEDRIEEQDVPRFRRTLRKQRH